MGNPPSSFGFSQVRWQPLGVTLDTSRTPVGRDGGDFIVILISCSSSPWLFLARTLKLPVWPRSTFLNMREEVLGVEASIIIRSPSCRMISPFGRNQLTLAGGSAMTVTSSFNSWPATNSFSFPSWSLSRWGLTNRSLASMALELSETSDSPPAL